MVKHYIIKQKYEESLNISIKIRLSLLRVYNELTAATGRSRNSIITQALQFALDRVEIIEPCKRNY